MCMSAISDPSCKDLLSIKYKCMVLKWVCVKLKNVFCEIWYCLVFFSFTPSLSITEVHVGRGWVSNSSQDSRKQSGGKTDGCLRLLHITVISIWTVVFQHSWMPMGTFSRKVNSQKTRTIWSVQAQSKDALHFFLCQPHANFTGEPKRRTELDLSLCGF